MDQTYQSIMDVKAHTPIDVLNALVYQQHFISVLHLIYGVLLIVFAYFIYKLSDRNDTELGVFIAFVAVVWGVCWVLAPGTWSGILNPKDEVIGELARDRIGLIIEKNKAEKAKTPAQRDLDKLQRDLQSDNCPCNESNGPASFLKK